MNPMKVTVALAMVFLLIAGCGGKGGTRVDELQTKVDDLTRRVKSLEDELLATEKKSIQQQQALQQMHDRLKTMEGYIDKLQYGQSVR